MRSSIATFFLATFVILSSAAPTPPASKPLSTSIKDPSSGALSVSDITNFITKDIAPVAKAISPFTHLLPLARRDEVEYRRGVPNTGNAASGALSFSDIGNFFKNDVLPVAKAAAPVALSLLKREDDEPVAQKTHTSR